MRIIHFTWLFHLFLHFCMISLIIFLFLALTTRSLIYLYSNWPQQYHLLSTTSTITIVEVICTQTDTLKYLNKCVSKELLISFLITNYCCHSSPLEPFDNFQQLHCFHDNQEYYWISRNKPMWIHFFFSSLSCRCHVQYKLSLLG